MKWDEIGWNSQSDELELIEDFVSIHKEVTDPSQRGQQLKTIFTTIALTFLASALSGSASFFLVGKVIPQVMVSFQNEEIWDEKFDQYAASEQDAYQKTDGLPNSSENVLALSRSEQDDISTNDRVAIAIRSTITNADASEINGELIRLAEIEAPKSDQSCRIKGNISLFTRERIYHLPDQKFYGVTEINPGSGERMFCSEVEAQQAGWQRSRI